MKFSFFRLFVCLLGGPVSYGTATAQKTFTIIYNYVPSKDLEDSFYFKIDHPIQRLSEHSGTYSLTTIRYIKEGNQHTTICSFEVADTSCVFLEDGFGHEIVAIPNDTMTVNVTKMQKTNGKFMLNNRFFSVWFHVLDYKGKNQFIYSLFDSLSFNQGILKFQNIPLKYTNYNLSAYFDSTEERFEQRTNYLEGYCARHHIPKNIQALAETEIQSAFYLSLIEPMESSNSSYSPSRFSSKYLNTLEKINLNWNDETSFFKTSLFSELTYRYFTAYKPFIENVKNRGTGYEYELINDRIKVEKIREFLLPFLLRTYLETGVPVADSLLSVFQSQFSDKDSYKYLDSLSSFKKKQRSISIVQALENGIADIGGKTMTIKDLFKDKFILIDCWATWCKPCIEQIPYTRKVATKYKDKLVVIYLSFDRDSIAWRKMAETEPGNAFLLTGNFRSLFANYFNINSIPRYLLFSNKGQVINADVPKPVHADAIDKILGNL